MLAFSAVCVGDLSDCSLGSFRLSPSILRRTGPDCFTSYTNFFPLGVTSFAQPSGV